MAKDILLQYIDTDFKVSFCSPVSLYDELSPLWFQVCEDGGRLESLYIKGLAALTADVVTHNIHSRLSEKPAGTVLTVLFQVEGLSTFFIYFCFFSILWWFSNGLIHSSLLEVVVSDSSLPCLSLSVVGCFIYDSIFLEEGRRSFFFF